MIRDIVLIVTALCLLFIFTRPPDIIIISAYNYAELGYRYAMEGKSFKDLNKTISLVYGEKPEMIH